MRKHIVESAAFEVATQVRAVEDVIESALEEIAELQGRMIRARAAAGVATATGHDAFKHLADAVQALVSGARRDGRLPWRAGRGEAVRPRPAHGQLRRHARNARRRAGARRPARRRLTTRIDRTARRVVRSPRPCLAPSSLSRPAVRQSACYALWRGGRDERRRRDACASSAPLATMLAVSPLVGRYRGVESGADARRPCRACRVRHASR